LFIPKRRISCAPEIALTRSFGQAVTELVDLIEAITEFSNRAAVKLRKQGSLTNQVMCFARTSPFRGDAQCSRAITVPLRRPTSDTAAIAGAVVAGLRAIYRPGFKFANAGVMVLDLQPASMHQGELMLEGDQPPDKTRLMAAFDALNRRYGQGTLQVASSCLSGEQRLWSTKQERRIRAYTKR
jgi:DNA polymerase V